jgi:hypothetical protein
MFQQLKHRSNVILGLVSVYITKSGPHLALFEDSPEEEIFSALFFSREQNLYGHIPVTYLELAISPPTEQFVGSRLLGRIGLH